MVEKITFNLCLWSLVSAITYALVCTKLASVIDNHFVLSLETKHIRNEKNLMFHF